MYVHGIESSCRIKFLYGSINIKKEREKFSLKVLYIYIYTINFNYCILDIHTTCICEKKDEKKTEDV